MRTLASGIIAVSLLGLVVAGSLNAGCAAAPEDDLGASPKKKSAAKDTSDDDDVEATGDDDDDDGSLPPATDGGTSTGKDASTPVKKDASVPPPPPPPPPTPVVGPAEGSACTTEEEIFEQGCGFCGTQQAICKGGKVSKYGVCSGSVTNGCTPGTNDSVACGLCGTQQRQCQNDCTWATGACGGEPATACEPNSTKYITAGCPTAGTYRAAKCAAATCTAGSYSDECSAPVNPNKLSVSQTVGNEVGGTYTLSTALQTRHPTGYSCSNASLSADRTPYAFVEVANKGTKSAKITAYTKKATGGEELDVVIWGYTGDLPPQDEPHAAACSVLSDGCGGTTPKNICGNSSGDYGTQLAGVGNIVIPAGGKMLVYVGSKAADTTGPIQVKIRTDELK